MRSEENSEEFFLVNPFSGGVIRDTCRGRIFVKITELRFQALSVLSLDQIIKDN